MKVRPCGCSVVVALLCSCLSHAIPASATASTAVQVMENGICYHTADCPRLRFGITLPLEQASVGYRRCPVCRPPVPGEAPRPVAAPAASDPPAPRGTPTAAGDAVAVPATMSVPASGPPAVRQAGHRGKYRWAGLGIGAAIGFLGAAAVENPVLIAAGALAGYAVGGGFAERTEAALDRGREAIRESGAGPSETASAKVGEMWSVASGGPSGRRGRSVPVISRSSETHGSSLAMAAPGARSWLPARRALGVPGRESLVALLGGCASDRAEDGAPGPDAAPTPAAREPLSIGWPREVGRPYSDLTLVDQAGPSPPSGG